MNYRDIIGILGMVVVLYLTLNNGWNYIRLPEIPVEVNSSEAAKLVERGERPFVAITDAQWDCENIYVRRGKSRWVTDVVLQTASGSDKVIAHFWNKVDCQSLQGKAVTGVLEPIAGLEYTDLQKSGLKFSPSTTTTNILHLCVTCNKEYYLGQMPIFVLCLVAVVIVNLALLRRFFAKLKKG